MHLYETKKGEDAARFCIESLKLDATQLDLSAVDRIEIFGTDIDDPGADYCEFRVIDSKDKVIAVRRELGY